MVRTAFVAHKYEEAEFVHSLAASIITARLGWIFEEVVPLSDAWRPVAEAAISRSDAFVLLATQPSVNSKNCELEWEYATVRGKPILVAFRSADQLPELPPILASAPSVVLPEDEPTRAAAIIAGALNYLVEERRS
jgi:hypothetical protein